MADETLNLHKLISNASQPPEELLETEKYKLGTNWQSFYNFLSKKLQGLQTGVDALDRSLLGLQGITVIQGEPAACKSTLALQIAHQAAKNGHPVLMLDMENGLQRLRMRLTCQSAGISQADLMCASKDDVTRYTAPVQALPLYVLTTPPKEPAHILEVIKALYKAHKKPVLLLADSLQSLPKLVNDERLSIQLWMEFLDWLKIKAEGKLYILLTSEKKRGAYGEASKDAGKGSGSIEYKAEIVLDLRVDNMTGNIILECKKFRDGLANFRIEFKKRLANNSNPRSFTFILDEVDSIELA